jgi:hypothetical protein
MSFSDFRHPLDIAQRPGLEPEVKRAILASWGSDAAAVPDRPGLRHPRGVKGPVPVDDIISALRGLDHVCGSDDKELRP